MNPESHFPRTTLACFFLPSDREKGKERSLKRGEKRKVPASLQGLSPVSLLCASCRTGSLQPDRQPLSLSTLSPPAHTHSLLLALIDSPPRRLGETARPPQSKHIDDNLDVGSRVFCLCLCHTHTRTQRCICWKGEKREISGTHSHGSWRLSSPLILAGETGSPCVQITFADLESGDVGAKLANSCQICQEFPRRVSLMVPGDFPFHAPPSTC